MATYLDVASLVGIKISAMGSLTKGDGAYTVPSDSYAEVYLMRPQSEVPGDSADHIMANKVIAVAGETIEYASGGDITVGSVILDNVNATTARVKYLVFTNNQ